MLFCVPSGGLPQHRKAVLRNDVKCIARNSIKRAHKFCYSFLTTTLFQFRTKYYVILRSKAT